MCFSCMYTGRVQGTGHGIRYKQGTGHRMKYGYGLGIGIGTGINKGTGRRTTRVFILFSP